MNKREILELVELSITTGRQLQTLDTVNNAWLYTTKLPSINDNAEHWRVKPEPKPNIFNIFCVERHSNYNNPVTRKYFNTKALAKLFIKNLSSTERDVSNSYITEIDVLR